MKKTIVPLLRACAEQRVKTTALPAESPAAPAQTVLSSDITIPALFHFAFLNKARIGELI